LLLIVWIVDQGITKGGWRDASRAKVCHVCIKFEKYDCSLCGLWLMY
jgi:hypothetical protein